MIRSFENFVVRCRVYDFNFVIYVHVLQLFFQTPRMINGAACCIDLGSPQQRRDVPSLSRVIFIPRIRHRVSSRDSRRATKGRTHVPSLFGFVRVSAS